MNIKVYEPYPGINKEQLKSKDVEINGKLATFFEITEKNYPNPVTGFFSCQKDDAYKKVVKKLNLNYRFKFFVMDYGELHEEFTGYTHLNFMNRFRIDWLFQQHWLQKSENIKWLMGVLVSSGMVVGIVRLFT